ncbi:MAG TPA: VWA domain-containing protein, partial [Vicinamibacterales bacterium]
MSTRVLLLAAAALLFAPPVSAQVTFKSGVDLVHFDVRVVDETGRPITDLKPEEIIIEEDGKRLPIMMFQRVSEPADESFQEESIRAVTAQVSSNEAFPRGHLYILIFDQEHITPGNEQRARMAAEQFIRSRVRPADRVALYAIPGPGPQMGFTADQMRAIDALGSIRGTHQRTTSTPFGTMALYEAHRLVQGDVKLLADVLERMQKEAGGDAISGDRGAGRLASGAAEDPSVTQRLLIENARVVVQQSDGASRQFLQRLADVITQFKAIEGRKTVVLFSEGFFQDNLSRELEEVAAAAAQSYCVFYTFDLNQRTGGLEEAQAPTTVRATEIQSRIAPLSTLAVETDGMMIVDAANRSGAALDQIADQTQDYYLLGFTPSEQALASRGKYRRVDVKVTRPGARVSARTGYAVSPEQTPTDRKRAINSVLGAPFAQQGLKLDYTTYVMKGAESGQHRVILSLNADLPVRSNPGEAADIVFVARDMQDGRIVANAADTLPLPSTARPGSALGTGSWRAQFNLPPGNYMMRMVVREPGGLVGSADRRIDVRPLTGPDVSTSDLVIGSALGGLPVRPRAYTEDGLTGILEAYGRTTAQLEPLN